MKIGVSLLNNWGIEDVHALVGLASRAEELVALCRWFIRIRWVAAGALFGVVAVTRWLVGIQLHLAQLFGHIDSVSGN